MPLDDMADQEPLSENWGLNRAQQWDLKLCWFPQKCFISNTPLWGKRAYRGIRWIHGPGEPIEQIYWVDKFEFLIWNLKRKK
jgi:hypothetical protein